MNLRAKLRSALLWLLLTAVLLPIVVCVLFGSSALLRTMGDPSGGGVLRGIALAASVAWGLNLILLLLGSALWCLSDSNS